MSKFSASRIGCFSGCPLRYKFQYVDNFTRFPDASNEFANKGLCVHQTVEKYNSKMSREELFTLLEENIKKYDIDIEKYSVHYGVERFLIFWNNFIQPLLDNGYSIQQEGWVNGIIARTQFTGALDVCLEKENDITYIIDYKTGKSMFPQAYKNQQLLYAYLKGKEKNWDDKTIVEKTKIIIFYPLGEEKSKRWETATEEEKALLSAKEIIFDENDLKEVINNYYIKNLLEINKIDFSALKSNSGNVGHDCSYCPFAGAKPIPEIGFIGCEKSIELGVEFPDGYEIIKKGK